MPLLTFSDVNCGDDYSLFKSLGHIVQQLYLSFFLIKEFRTKKESPLYQKYTSKR